MKKIILAIVILVMLIAPVMAEKIVLTQRELGTAVSSLTTMITPLAGRNYVAIQLPTTASASLFINTSSTTATVSSATSATCWEVRAGETWERNLAASITIALKASATIVFPIEQGKVQP